MAGKRFPKVLYVVEHGPEKWHIRTWSVFSNKTRAKQFMGSYNRNGFKMELRKYVLEEEK